MEQDQGIKKKKIRRFQEVELRESEFKKAGELDSDEFKDIRDEYFKGTFIYSLIAVMFGAAAAAFAIIYGYAIPTVWLILLAICISLAPVFGFRCIVFLILVSKIKKQDFYWHIGRITHRKRLWLPFFSRVLYYLVDDEYCSRVIFDPFYRKGTEVYFLYFPGFWGSSYIGGIVVRKKRDGEE